ncbi:ring-1,2-phenylacetyl-CoA epoxidase subunit PaaD [Bacillus sp. OV322]|uniref:1,2-phenylacetyl-CoA epoxidase subunit PaaD n=1 Tax=Bacillus sp. OV322 TaxID=1882764 RepID=UPI0008EA7D88|nr:1,2-phenylacetyl-CoA epoxidase subunit PaaD [Bacillus sp. OV322]SFC72131.1 ring-1,2-phenylacetyl-CoA epoxidase subunit PaaD [Bacillus sp. OV322]
MTRPNNSMEEEIWEAMKFVYDPEIPNVSLLDLGMIESVSFKDGTARIEVLPTFSGCPALEIIRKNIEKAILKLNGVEKAYAEFIFHPPWTTDRVSLSGRENLKKNGIAPPPEYLEEDGTWHVNCPYCSSPYITIENIFGSTACRSILYCKSCKNPFEAMKFISVNL